jgi:hypothetical protein
MTDRPRWYDWWRHEGERELALILWAAWDPIGHVPRDEYHDYVPRLWTLLRDHARVLKAAPSEGDTDAAFSAWATRVHASEQTIAQQLGDWRTGSMGLPADPDGDVTVAEKLSDWLNPPGVNEHSPLDLID